MSFGLKKKKSLILEQVKNCLLTSDKGQHQEAWAHRGHGSGRGAIPRQAGHRVWSLGLPVQTTEEVPACHWLLLEETAHSLRKILGGKGKPLFNAE